MRKITFSDLLLSPVILGLSILAASPAMAAGQPVESAKLSNLEVSAARLAIANPDTSFKVAQAQPSVSSLDAVSPSNTPGSTPSATNSTALSQVTSVSQLSDVKPTDWAFQALQSLVERYGCIAGYPDKTYRGNRALTRYEFAAGLNACLDRVNELIAAASADLVKKEDLATIQKLQEQFAAELATLRGRVDALDARTTTLEKQQFSTTTKLSGEVAFALTDEFGVKGTGGNRTVFQDRVRLSLNTSFTGKDLLVTRIAAGNAGTFTLDNPGKPGGSGAEGIQTFNFGNTGGNRAFVDWIAYFLPVGENLKFYIPAVSGLHYDYVPTVSPALDAADGATGPLSIFAQRNPIYLIGGGAGVGATFSPSKAIQFSAGYLADNSTQNRANSANNPVTFGANNPASKNGLFDGSYSALAQLTVSPNDALQLGLTYVNAYRRDAIFDGGSGVASSGTSFANNSIAGVGASATARSSAVNAYGVSAALKLSPGLVLNGFASLVNANFEGDNSGIRDIWTYGGGLALPDFGKKGNLLGLMIGAEPHLTNPTQAQRAAGVKTDKPLHFEGFYKYQVTDNISVTPGVIWLTNPGQNSRNDDAVIGTVRTTFTF